MEFPRLVYKSAVEHRLAESKEEFSLLLKEGWFASVPEAIAKEHADETTPPTRDELEAKAKELDIKFTKKIPDSELSQLITDALKV